MTTRKTLLNILNISLHACLPVFRSAAFTLHRHSACTFDRLTPFLLHCARAAQFVRHRVYRSRLVRHSPALLLYHEDTLKPRIEFIKRLFPETPTLLSRAPLLLTHDPETFLMPKLKQLESLLPGVDVLKVVRYPMLHTRFACTLLALRLHSDRRVSCFCLSRGGFRSLTYLVLCCSRFDIRYSVFGAAAGS